MKERLIEFETAKLAKEKGFDIPVRGRFAFVLSLEKFVSYSHYGEEHYFNDKCLWQPSQSLLQQWLRKNHNIDITIHRSFSMDNSYHYCIINNGNYDEELQQEVTPHRTFENALELALISALNLI